MKTCLITAILAAAFATTLPVHAQTAPADEQDVDIEAPQADPASAPRRAVSPQLAKFCFFAGQPPADAPYQVVRQLRVGKGSYGQVIDILPRLAEAAAARGADAIINYTGSQRFGFFPWRVVRPVVRGVAVKWTQPPGKDCAGLGGSTLQTILDTDKAPE